MGKKKCPSPPEKERGHIPKTDCGGMKNHEITIVCENN